MGNSTQRRVVGVIATFTLLTMGLNAAAFADDTVALPSETGQSSEVADGKQSDSAQSETMTQVDKAQSLKTENPSTTETTEDDVNVDAPALAVRGSLAQAINDHDLVNWNEAFPDATFRALVQDRFSNPQGVTYGNLKTVSSIDASGQPVTSVEGLALLPRLSVLDLSNTQVQSVDLSANSKILRVNLEGTPICPTVDFKRHGQTAYFDTYNCGMRQADRAPFAEGAYQLSGVKHTFSFLLGSGTTSYFNISPSKHDSLRPYAFSVSPRGTKNVILVNDSFLREEVRMVQNDGTILHRFTITNISSQPQATQISQVLDTELDGNDHVNIFSTGQGSAVISNNTLSVYLDAVNLPEGKMYAGRWGSSRDAASILHRLESNGIEITDSLTSRQLTKSVDSAVYYILNPRTLAPGESVAFSVREALHTVSDIYSARVDYVVPQEDGSLSHVGFATHDGNKDEVWDISTAPGLPAGYEVLTDREQVRSVVLGHDGQLTVVKVYVKLSDTADTDDPAPTPPQEDKPNDGDQSETTKPDSGKTPTDKTPTDKTPTDKTPTDKTPTDKTPTDKTSKGKSDTGKSTKGKDSKKLASTGFDTTTLSLASLLAAGGALIVLRRRK